MRLRELEDKDAWLMYEWMHDENAVRYMRTDFASKTIQDCRDFISASHVGSRDIHLCIADDADTYLGTVSLKDIRLGSAEFAISIRSLAMGTGAAKQAMEETVAYAKNGLGLHFVYWCVAKPNLRAVKFYEKNGYRRIDMMDQDQTQLCQKILEGGYSKSQILSYIWYGLEI